MLQNALGLGCKIFWPVEGAMWTSPDWGLSIRVLSPAGRLIERLLVGEDALSLFLEHPTPLGWLLGDSAESPPGAAPSADPRDANDSDEITPEKITVNTEFMYEWLYNLFKCEKCYLFIYFCRFFYASCASWHTLCSPSYTFMEGSPS